MLQLWPAPSRHSRRDPSRCEDHWHLPQRVQQVPQHPSLRSAHLSPPFFSSILLSRAICFASICLLLIKLMTSSSVDPPNIRSTRSRTAWPDAAASLTVALYSYVRPTRVRFSLPFFSRMFSIVCTVV